MITRREAVRLLSSASAGIWFGARTSLPFPISHNSSTASAENASTPQLAPGSPNSPERVALIDAFKKQSEGLEQKYEARTYKSDWTMPYRLFRPETNEKVPFVIYLRGSGEMGEDNLKQAPFGNV